MWEHFLPVLLSGMLAVVKERTALPVHKGKERCDVRGLEAFFCILFGACQFKPGTDLWSTDQKKLRSSQKHQNLTFVGWRFRSQFFWV
jgi:hypothetical protein